MKAKRQKHSGAFKSKVAIEALQERMTLSELSQKFGLHPNQISRWKKEFLERAPRIFEVSVSENKDDTEKIICHDRTVRDGEGVSKKNLKKLGL